jgi:hypothetical protein
MLLLLLSQQLSVLSVLLLLKQPLLLLLRKRSSLLLQERLRRVKARAVVKLRQLAVRRLQQLRLSRWPQSQRRHQQLRSLVSLNDTITTVVSKTATVMCYDDSNSMSTSTTLKQKRYQQVYILPVLSVMCDIMQCVCAIAVQL